MTYEDRVRRQLEINAAFGPQPAAAGPGINRAPPAAKMRGKKTKMPTQKGMGNKGGKSGKRC